MKLRPTKNLAGKGAATSNFDKNVNHMKSLNQSLQKIFSYRHFILILFTACLLLLNALQGSAQVLDVEKLIGKNPVERGEPVPITIRLKGDEKKLCKSTAIAIVLDVSGSLNTWHGEVKSAVEKSLPLISPGQDMMAIASFAKDFNILQSWTDNGILVKIALTNLNSGGSTDLEDAINGTNLLMQNIPGNTTCKAALIVTDGKGDLPSHSLLNMAQTNGWKYFFLGVGNQDSGNLTWMANSAGGKYMDTSKPPYSGTIHNNIVLAVDEFIDSAMEIVAPSNIVITEEVSKSVNVLTVSPPTAPPNQLDPKAYTSSATTAWAMLGTIGKATLPSIDRLDIGLSGAVKEYSIDFEITVNTCDDQKAITYFVDGPGSQVTYFVKNVLTTVQIPNIKFTVNPCDIPIIKTWNAEQKIIRIELKNNFSHTATDLELFEIINSPLVFSSTSIPTSLGGPGDNFARFHIPNIGAGDEFKVTLGIKASMPLPHFLGNKIQVNNLMDSYLSFQVPYFATEFGPTSPHYAVLDLAIKTGVLGSTGKQLLEKAAFKVPHAQDTEVDVKQKILPNTNQVWPEFDWSVAGDKGSFLIRKVGTSYEIYVVHRKWKRLQELYVDREEINQ